MSADPNRPSVDAREIDQFERLGDQWWSADGPMKALHDINPVRLRWMRDAMIEHFVGTDGGPRDQMSFEALEGLRILDVGCGGGVLSEPLARMGARVTGIDPAPGNVEIARAHAAEVEVEVDYRAASVEELAAAGETFDVVCAMEVVEHVLDPASFVRAACGLVKPGGLFFGATINRNLKSFALAIVGAEYVLRWVAPGTHKWEKFVTPEEFEAAIRSAGMEVWALAGVSYNPFRREWDTSRDLDVNYMLAARRLVQMA